METTTSIVLSIVISLIASVLSGTVLFLMKRFLKNGADCFFFVSFVQICGKLYAWR